MAKAKQPKLTKKMLSVLDKAEVRTIIMTGMGVKPETAYQADVKWCIDHIYTNQEEFSQADLESIEMKRFRNPAVYMYVRKLQGFLQGTNEAPAWPPTPEEMEYVPKTNVAEPADNVVKGGFKPVVVEKVQKTTEPPVENEVKEEISSRGHAVAAPKNIGDPVEDQISFTKVAGFGNKKKEEEPAPDQNFDELLQKTVEAYSVVDGNVLEVQIQLSKLEGFTQTKLSEIQSRMMDIEKSLLFIINSAILPEGQEVHSLNQIPSPPYN